MPCRHVFVDPGGDRMTRRQAIDHAPHALRRLRKTLCKCLRQQCVLGFEVRVEAAMRQPGGLHHLGDREPFGTFFPQRLRRKLEKPRMGFLLVGGRVPHALLNLLQRLYDSSHIKLQGPMSATGKVVESHTAAATAHLSDGRKLIIFAIMAFGQFMALLDTQIVAASLNSIQAGLSAGPDEIAWVQTAYLMAEIVMIPLAAFLSQAISTRWLFTLSAVLFTLSSLLCGMAWSIQSMTMFRALQGFVGGA